ncbi:MAG: hypothetical protein M1830_010059 [Pleopsidium flavum]|nr:MAG: hypothetical protein M1830_010059 [Pleopsidium flavum]
MRGGANQQGDLTSRRHVNHVDTSSQYLRRARSLTASPSSSNAASTIITAGRPQRRQLIKHIFTRHSEDSASGMSAALPSFDQPPQKDENIDAVSTAPSPHTHPLLTRPIARDEAIQGHLQVAIAKGTTPRPADAQFAAARRDAEKVRMSNTAPLPTRLSADSYEIRRRPTTACDIYTKFLRDREKTAMTAAAQTRYIPEWGFFLKCYAEGRYNISTPPDPPPRHAPFLYLPAPAPPNEVERLKAVEHNDVEIFPRWAAEKQKQYVLLARHTFSTPFAAISYISRTHEVLRCEIGYRPDYLLGYIPRGHSLAAHAILSSEPMVILDTFKDWRTQGNPLVQGHPKIRFYAAAPLITKKGHFLGAFAVFDDKPRSEFGIIVRRQLFEFAKRVTLDLEEAGMQYYEARANSVGLRMALIENFRTQSVNGASREDGERRVPEIPARSPSRLFARNREIGVEGFDRLSSEPPTVVENTPPDSDYGSDHTLERNGPGPKVKRPHHRQSSASSKATAKSTRDSVILSGPSTPPRTPPTPFSVSTIGSRVTPQEHERPPNMPVEAVQRTSVASASSMQTILHVEDDFIPAPLRSSSLSNKSRRELDQLPHTPDPHHSVAEASFAVALVAGSLGYDFLYLLRFGPVAEEIIGEDLTPGGNFETGVLVSYGMPHPEPCFDPGLHLRALRASRGLIYQNPNPVPVGSTVEYEFGLLLSVAHYKVEGTCPKNEGSVGGGGIEVDIDRQGTHPAFRNYPNDCSAKTKEKVLGDSTSETGTIRSNVESCRSGVILAGFMRKAPIDGELSSENIAEMRKLGRRLKELLLDGDH